MSTTHKGLTIPEQTDPADANAAFEALVASGPIPRFADAAARDAAVPSPSVGDLVHDDETGFLNFYGTYGWRGLGPTVHEALGFWDSDIEWSENEGYISSVFYTEVTDDPDVAFPEITVPTNGTALVVLSAAGMTNDASGIEAAMAVKVNGTLYAAHTGVRIIPYVAQSGHTAFGFHLFTDLPGGYSTFQLVGKTANGLATAYFRQPCLQVIVP